MYLIKSFNCKCLSITGNAYLRALQGIEYRVIWEESMDERPWEKARSMYNDELEAGYKSVSLLDGIVG